MSTHCLIASSVSKRSIYCHFDGYPEGVGRTLKEHYSDSEKIEKLMELGDISILGEDVDPADDNSHPPDGKNTIAYRRDRKETETQARSFNDEKNLYDQAKNYVEYIYLWNGKEWIFNSVCDSEFFSVLT